MISVMLLATTIAASSVFVYQWLNGANSANAEKHSYAEVNTSGEAVLSIADLSSSTIVSSTQMELPDAELIARQAGFELYEIGKKPWSDDEFYQLTLLLKKHPEMVKPLALEYRGITERPAQIRLAMLLGQFDDTIITDIGVELSLSGDAASQRSGLRLLGTQQTRVPRARKTIADIMAVETRPEVLKAALQAMAKPAKTDEAEHRYLLDRYTRLSKSDNPEVRALSLSIIARWSGDVDTSDIMVNGLDDSNPEVRKNATLAFLKTRHLPEEAKLALLERLEDSTEKKRTRQAALYVLKRFNLSEDEKSRYEAGRQAVEIAPKN